MSKQSKTAVSTVEALALAADPEASVPTVSLATPTAPAGTKVREDGKLVCNRCGHVVHNTVENDAFGEVGHVCATNLATGYRSVQGQVAVAPEGWVLVSQVYARIWQAGDKDITAAQFHRLQGGDGGVHKPVIEKFGYVYVGGDPSTGKGGRKWMRDLDVAAIKALIAEHTAKK